ncbi:hypothetical protein PanWU01x14_205180 [Parasponia andersonii]|uniref:Uncharacterized protein n=1 Tax=Parasponia andersonii TaxID=3476 RepID=A0A2P5BW26_PARAD|nr:hypothetical protein PanWU01x14_205180 [Parasponia andersonii]
MNTNFGKPILKNGAFGEKHRELSEATICPCSRLVEQHGSYICWVMVLSSVTTTPESDIDGEIEGGSCTWSPLEMGKRCQVDAQVECCWRTKRQRALLGRLIFDANKRRKLPCSKGNWMSEMRSANDNSRRLSANSKRVNARLSSSWCSNDNR